MKKKKSKAGLGGGLAGRLEGELEGRLEGGLAGRGGGRGPSGPGKGPSGPPSSSTRLAGWLVAYGLPEPILEWKFHPTRRWRTDLGWPGLKIAIEIEGGVYTRGRHTSPSGFVNDMEKYNALAVLGILLIRILPSQVELSDPAGRMASGAKGGAKGRVKKNLGAKNRWKRTPAHEIVMELFNQRGL